MKVAAWAMNLACPVTTLEGWAALVETQVAAAKEQGAELFLMPEYSAAHWLHLIPRGLPGPEQLARLSAYAPEAVRLMSALAAKYNLLLVSGTFPVARPELNPPLTNRAHIHFPHGRVLTQDKLCLIPSEKDPQDWNLSPGDTLTVFEWQGYRMAVIICLDIELPALSVRLAGLNLDLLLVPSMTVKLAGYHRVFTCARGRAVELMTAVAAVGTIAGAPKCEQEIGGASFFLPAEEQFGSTGVLAEIVPAYTAEGAGPLLIRDLPLAEIRTLRSDGKAEVWPGAWRAEGVMVRES